MNIKVTRRTIKLRAIYETIKALRILFPAFIMDIKLIYYRYYNAMMELLIKNPNLKW